MLKNILTLNGVQTLSKKEQKAINGGIPAGCHYETWPGTSLAFCKENLGGNNFTYSNGMCKAYFCRTIVPPPY
ncbi:hypothetical protein [Flavobacterium sp.]|uniref:hypothetical protein n=1 Tax=Flavobacterium sp. TaxID=239 RepID=UPI003D6C2866